eukprot:CFRG8203T1
MGDPNPFLPYEFPKNLFLQQSHGHNQNHGANQFGWNQGGGTMSDSELLQLLSGDIGANPGRQTSRHNNQSNQQGQSQQPGMHHQHHMNQQLQQQSDQAWMKQKAFLNQQQQAQTHQPQQGNGLSQYPNMYDNIHDTARRQYSLTRDHAQPTNSFPSLGHQNHFSAVDQSCVRANSNASLSIPTLGHIQGSQNANRTSPVMFGNADRLSINDSPTSSSTDVTQTRPIQAGVTWQVAAANAAAAATAALAPPTDALLISKKRTAARQPSFPTGTQRATKKDKKMTDKKPYIFDYWSHSKELRVYLAKHMSDEMIDDLEEMAKCIYEQQLEAMLPMDYKDMLYFEDVIVRMTRFHEVFLDTMVLPGIVYRRTGCILGMNEAFCQMLQRTRSELVDSNIVYFISHDELFEAVKNFVLKLAFPGRPHSVIHDVCFTQPNGNRVYARSHVHMQRNMHNMPAVFVGIFMPYANTDWKIPHVGILD